MTKRFCVLVALAVVVIACGGGRAVTEKRMLEWGPILNMYMGTNFDGWRNRFLYRRLRVDKYNIISAGPDGEFGNADDVVLENGLLTEPMTVYSKNPLE